MSTAVVSPYTMSVASKLKPFVVDLDGTHARSNVPVESAFVHLGRDPWRGVSPLSAIRRGKAGLKAGIGVSHLPYDEDAVSLIRPSASDEHYVQAVGDHLGLFDGWFASNDNENLSSGLRARRLVEAFAEAASISSVTNAPISPCEMSLVAASHCALYLMERNITNHCKFHETHGEDLCQIDIFGGLANPAARGIVIHASSRRQ